MITTNKQTEAKAMQTFLIKPFDHLMIREDPMYRGEKIFTLETLTPELKLDKDKATSRDFPEAETVEEFLQCVMEDQKFANTPGKMRVAKQVRREGWVRVEAEDNYTVDQLWKRAMDKVAHEDFYNPNKRS